MSKLTLSGILLLVLSFFFALVLSIIPLPSWGELLRPAWLVLAVIYWILVFPQRVSLGTAWILGLLLDALYGSVLGEHALALAVVAYLTEKFHRQMRMFPLVQQALCVLLVVAVYQLIILWIQGMLGQLSNVRWFWLSTLTSVLFWPWVYWLLRATQQRWEIG